MKDRRLLIATTNRGKLREIEPILAMLPIELVTLAEFPSIPEPAEPGQTFAENARLKALFYAEKTGELTVAEDSGLVIDALDGAPGVHSARWHGNDYAVKFRKIKERLAEKGLTTSPARFVAHLTLARGRDILFEAHESIEGRIADAPAGDRGFGYDPIFFYPPLGKTTGQMDPVEKARVSHRGKAFMALRDYLARSRG